MTRKFHMAAVGLALLSLAIAGPSLGAYSGKQTRPSSFLTPVSYSAACRADSERREACNLVSNFFRSVNSGRFGTACTLLGTQLRTETAGPGCPALIKAGSGPHPWGIRGARATASGVQVRVVLGQSELGHERMRVWIASVGIEGTSLKILETTLVR
jgi:hypothetical protein